jgi:hypothetical protein
MLVNVWLCATKNNLLRKAIQIGMLYELLHRYPEFVTQDLPTSIVGYKSEIVGSEQKYFFIL